MHNYECGYCIANILTGMSFGVYLLPNSKSLAFQHFICGLKTNVPSVGYIEELHVQREVFSHSGLEYCSLQRLTSLGLRSCDLTETDMIHLSELIPRMTCLTKLDISFNVIRCVQEDCFVKVLQALSHSRVTTLNIMHTDFCKNQSESFLAALKQLIDPSCGTLEEMLVGDYPRTVKMNSRVIDCLSAHSSLKSLTLYVDTPSLLSPLTSNTCLIELRVTVSSSSLIGMPAYSNLACLVSELVVSNKTLKHLTIERFKLSKDYSALKVIVASLHHNKTLLKLKVGLKYPPTVYETAFQYARDHDSELTLDPRIVYNFCS